MTKVSFYALNPEGRLEHQVLEAPDSASLEAALRAQQLAGGVMTTPRAIEAGRWTRLLGAFQRPTSEEIAIFAHQLAALLSAGLPLLRSLELAGGQTRNRAISTAAICLADDVAAGGSLHRGCERFPQVFDEVSLGLLQASEADGSLAEAFAQIAADRERAAADRRELLSAVVYPTVCLGLAVFMTVWLGSTFVPQIVDLSASLGVEAPQAVRVFTVLSETLASCFPWVAVSFALALGGWHQARLNERWREATDRLLLRLPLVGSAIRAGATARLMRTFGSLYERGLPILATLEVTRSVLGNQHLASALDEVAEQIRAGVSLARALDQTGEFNPLAVSMAEIGEASGSMGELFLRGGVACREQARLARQRVMSILRPLLLGTVGAAVAGLLAAIYIPLVELVSRVGM